MTSPDDRVSIPEHVALPGGIQADVHILQPYHLPAALAMWTAATSTGQGFAQNETETEDTLLAYNRAGGRSSAHVVLNRANGEMIAVLVAMPSGMCRSSHPMYAGGFLLIAKAYRRKGVGASLYHQVYVPIRSHHYQGGVYRTSLLADAKAATKVLCQFAFGVAPDCTLVAGKGWTDDLFIVDAPTYMDVKRGSQVKANRTNLPPLRMREVPDPAPGARRNITAAVLFPDFHVNSMVCSVGFATPNDSPLVEEMIRDAALGGQGFAVDEFKEDGTFNRKFIRNSLTVVCKNFTGDIMAAVLFGSSGLCRTEGDQATGYIIVAPSVRGRGIGTTLLRYCLERARGLRYGSIVTDVLACNLKALGMVQKEGFLVTATLPNSALVRNYGYCDTYVVWRPVQATPHSTSKL